MAKLQKVAGATSEIWQVFIADSSSTVGAGLTGLAFNTASLVAYFHRDVDTTATVMTLVTMTIGTFTSLGFKEIDATNMPGWYQLCPPNTALAAGAKSCAFMLKGATNMAPLPIEVQLSAVNVDSATGFVTSVPLVVGAVGSVTGLTASDVGAIKTKTDFLPSVTAGAAGGVFIAGTNAATAITTSLTLGGVVDVPQTGDAFADTTNIKTRLPAALTANGNMKSSLVEILTTVLTETAGQLAGGFKKFFNIATPASTMDVIALVTATTTATTVTNDVGITQTGADKVWATAARLLTAGTNIVLAKGVGVTGFTDLSAAGTENAVWDAVRASHTTAGSFGQGAASVQGNVTGSVATIGPNGLDSTALAASASAAIVAAIGAKSYGASYNSRTTDDLAKMMLAFLAGKASGLDTGNVIYRSPADDKDVLSTTGCTVDGNRPNAITVTV